MLAYRYNRSVSWEKSFHDLKKTCEMLAWIKTTQHKVSRLLWPDDPHLEVLCNQKGVRHPGWPAYLSFDLDRAYQELHRLIGSFSGLIVPTVEERREWFGLKHLIHELLRKPRAKRPADDPIYSLLRTRLRELYTEVVATNREFVWTDFRDLFLSLFPSYVAPPLALMQPSLQGAKLALRPPKHRRPTDGSGFYVVLVTRDNSEVGFVSGFGWREAHGETPEIIATRSEADLRAVAFNRSVTQAWFFVIDRPRASQLKALLLPDADSGS